MTFQYDAADHILSIHDGVITVSGAINETLDLSQDPVSGIPPVGSLATIQLVRGATAGGMTEFEATLTQPTIFSDTFSVDAGITNVDVTVDVTGQVVARGFFSLHLDGGSSAGPGDLNGGGAVEQADLDLVLLNWGEDLADPAAIGWINNPPSGIVDQEELDSVLLNWGNTSASHGAAGVPEPATLLLLAVACPAAWFFSRGAHCKSRPS
jgi:hypothetical protein